MQSINEFSLLFPEGKENCFQVLSGITCNDLSIDYICSELCNGEIERKNMKRLLTAIPNDVEVIRYRNSIYNDLKKSPDFCKEVEDILIKIDFLARFKQNKKSWDKASIWDLVSRLRELETYIECIIKLKKCIDDSNILSEGLNKLKDYINGIYNDSGFDEFQEDIKNIGYDMSTIKSISLGINLDKELYPKEVGIVSINNKYFKEMTFLKRFLNYHKEKQEGLLESFDDMAFSTPPNENVDKGLEKMLNTPSNGNSGMSLLTHPFGQDVNPVMNNLTKLIEDMLSKNVKDLKDTLQKYVNVSGYALVKLSDQIRFYLRFIELEKKINDLGLPTTMGEIEKVQGECNLQDFYNIKLALFYLKNNMENDIVKNELVFSKENRVYILTGPNRGGKTIFTQGIGLAFLLFNSGVFIPCSKGRMSLCDNIFTHFPADENKTVEMGRLGEEAKRLSEICKNATKDTVILFNESFATTSHTESLYIAKDVLKYLCDIGVRTCFNTHIHELAESVDEINKDVDSEYKSVSIVMGLENGKRSYKTKISKPQGKSFARDIAYKYGITYEQLKSENRLKGK
ncbi:MAG: MutS-related protein [Eubacteriales bacterium]